jgi:hypothetical protein
MISKINYLYIFIIFIIIFIVILILLYSYTQYNINLTIYNIINKNIYNKNKKTCILISGQIRGNFLEIYSSQKLFIIDPLNCDIFCVFDDNIAYNKKKYIEKLIQPKKILWISENNNSNNIMHIMYHKIYLCNKLKYDYEINNNFIYDNCIRIRPDLFIKSYIPDYIINNIDSNTFYTPYFYIFDYFTNVYSLGVSDQIFICNSNIMDIISINNINLKNNCESSEITLKRYLKEKNINIKKFYNFYFVIYDYSVNNILEMFKIISKKKKDVFHLFNINCY